MVVAKERKPTVPSMNAKAIGIPITIEKTTNPTKKMRRFVLPMSSNTGPSQYSTPTAITTKAEGGADLRTGAIAQQLVERGDQHQDNAHQHGGAAVSFADLQHRAQAHAAFIEMLVARQDQRQEKRRDQHQGDRLEPCSPLGTHVADECGEPHVLAAPQSDDRAEHGEP